MPEFVRFPHPLLHRAAVRRPVDDVMRDVGERLKAAASEVQAYGLAAAHLGDVEPIVIISIAPDSTSRDYRILFNPEVISASSETSAGPEGSVSMPGVEVSIVRPLAVELAYDDGSGLRTTMRLNGFAARVAQHEIDQLNGIFFLDRLSRLKRDMTIRRYSKVGVR